MKTLPEDLPNDVEALKALLLEQAKLLGKKDSLLNEKDSQLAEWQSKYQLILEQWRLAQQKQFGKSSEVSPGQGELFDEAAVETEENDVDVEPETHTLSYTHSKPKRKPLPKDLPRGVVVLDIAESDKVCSSCQGERHCIGEDRSEKLEFIPAQLKVIETVRPKYACRECEKTGTQNAIKQAPMPPSIIPKGIATPSLLSQIITGKFQYSLPLYRQETLFKQYGIELNRRTMSDWMKKCADALLALYERLYRELLKQSVIQADETTLNVIKEARSKCYMWVYCTGKDAPDKHNRRKFIEAEKGMSKGKSGKATMAISYIKKLYAIETLAQQADNAEDAFKIRRRKAPEVLASYKAWLEKSAQQIPPKSLLGKAIQYNLNQWDKLSVYLTDYRVNIDNNRAERAIKPFVIGRKNWLFSNTGNGAKSSAILYSIIETAKSNGLIPYDYLVKLFKELPKRETGEDIDDLLPWNVKLTP